MLDPQLADQLTVPETRSNPPCPHLAADLDRLQPDNGPWHIRVYSVVDLDGARSISPGLEPTAATVLARAAPRSDGLLRSQATLDTGASVVGVVPDRPAWYGRSSHGAGRPSTRGPSLRRRRADRRSLSFGKRWRVTSRFEYLPTSRGNTPACFPTRTWNLMRSFRSAFGTQKRVRPGSETESADRCVKFRPFAILPECTSYVDSNSGL